MQKILNEANFEGPYRQLVGGLLYLSVCTRKDIAYALSVLTQQFANPKQTHFHMALRVLHYLTGTRNFGLILGGEEIPQINAFSDADFANCEITRKSMGGYVIFFGNSSVSWSAKKHRGIQALSSAESKIMQTTDTTREIMWVQPLIFDLIGIPKN